MGRKRTKVDYRQLYKDYYGIDFGDDMVVHHIDFDRSNNNIGNLLLMPKELHAKYHWHITSLGGAGTGKINSNMLINGDTYKISSLRGLADALDEIMEWYMDKCTLDSMKYHGVRWDDFVNRK